jgi:hypothetical protein
MKIYLKANVNVRRKYGGCLTKIIPSDCLLGRVLFLSVNIRENGRQL